MHINNFCMINESLNLDSSVDKVTFDPILDEEIDYLHSIIEKQQLVSKPEKQHQVTGKNPKHNLKTEIHKWFDTTITQLNIVSFPAWQLSVLTPSLFVSSLLSPAAVTSQTDVKKSKTDASNHKQKNQSHFSDETPHATTTAPRLAASALPNTPHPKATGDQRRVGPIAIAKTRTDTIIVSEYDFISQ